MITGRQIRQALLILILIYLALFAIRAAYDLTRSETSSMESNVYYTNAPPTMESLSKNIASLRVEYEVYGGVEILDQKYERIATLASRTVSFDTDEALVNASIEDSKAVVQMENKQGLTGSRRLTMVIGVKPQFFDDCKDALSKIGRLISSTVTKTDKTYEYRQMLAEKEKLEKQKESYNSLKSHGGSISELLMLEEKIIEVESQITQQSVNLGEYNDDNAFCTIEFSLYEGSVASIPRILLNSISWSTWIYIGGIGLVLLTLFAAFVLVKFYTMLKTFLIKKKVIAGTSTRVDSGNNEDD